jgi:glycosyltransferase involved in cell wall biosynthesis
MRAILILDTSYTLKIIKKRNLYEALHARKLGGYFSKVISVHPLSGLNEGLRGRFGNPIISKIDKQHLFVSGKIGVYKFLKLFPSINFILSQIKLIKFLYNLSIKYKVQIIRVGDPYYLGLLGVILSKILKVPLVIRIGANFDEIVKQTNKPIMKKLFKYRFIEKIIERFVLSRCNLVAAANKNNANSSKKNGAKKELITIFKYGNLIHPCHWLNPKNRKISKSALSSIGLKNTIFVAIIARLEIEKKVDSIIKACAKLKEKKYNVKFLIIGDGSELQNLKELSTKLGVNEKIIFVGNKDQIWISKILPKALAVLSPHGGRSLTESCLAAVPIVAYDHDWQNEIIKNNRTGFLIKDQNWTGFADKIIYIIKNKKRAHRFGRNARKKILKIMNPEKLKKHEIFKYNQVIKKFKSKKF